MIPLSERSEEFPSPASRHAGGDAMRALDIARRAWKALDSKKGENIVLLDVRELSNVTDYYLIVSGSSGPHLKALFSEVEHTLKQEGVYCYRRGGEPDTGWLVLDYIDVVVHVFLGEIREYYAIEELWSKARRITPG